MQTRIPVVQGRVGSSLFVARLTKQGEPDFLLDPPSLETLDIGACGQYVQPKSNSSKLDPTRPNQNQQTFGKSPLFHRVSDLLSRAEAEASRSERPA
jgi:hypothetical protein